MSSKANISIERQLSYSNGGEQGGVDIREPSTALFGVSSIDRYNTIASSISYPLNLVSATSPYDFQVTAPAQSLLNGYFTRLAVNEVQFRWTLPTLTARNNKIYINYAPANNSVLTSITQVGTLTTFGMASTTGYTAGDVIRVGMPPVVVNGVSYEVSGLYTITGVTGTSLQCNDPLNLPDFVQTFQTGSVAIRRLVTITQGWYDLNNVNYTNVATRQGNLAYEFQDHVRSLSGNPLPNFTCEYSTNLGTTTTQIITDTSPVSLNVRTTETISDTAPFNAFQFTSGSSTTFYFEPYVEITRPNAVSLFQMMSLKSIQTLATTQSGSPNVSLLSTPFVDICCEGLTYNQALKDTDTGLISRTMLCRLWLTPDAFTGNTANLGANPILIHRTFPFPKQIRWNAMQPIGNLRFQVFDSQGYILTTFDNQTSGTYIDADMGDFSLSLLVSEV